jgi:hypothetical protein
MATIVKRLNWSNLWHGFVKSNYITALWNWFMGLAGKAAEPVLFASVLYSGYQLVPGVPQPTAGINAIAFVTQQAALDVGGMGLIKLTKDEAPEKFRFARATGIALISLMVVNMVVATAGRVFPVPPQVMQITEGILLIIRSVMAVLFGHAIHTLKDDSIDVADLDIDAIVDQAIETETAQLKAAYEALKQQMEEVKNQQPVQHFIVQQETFLDDTPAQEEVQPVDVQPVENTAVPTLQNSMPPVRKSASPKVQKDGATRAVDALKKDANLTAKQLAEKARISESYAQKIKADFAKSAGGKPEPKAQDTDPIPVQKSATNGHKKVTQPLGDLIELKV